MLDSPGQKRECSLDLAGKWHYYVLGVLQSKLFLRYIISIMKRKYIKVLSQVWIILKRQSVIRYSKTSEGRFWGHLKNRQLAPCCGMRIASGGLVPGVWTVLGGVWNTKQVTKILKWKKKLKPKPKAEWTFTPDTTGTWHVNMSVKTKTWPMRDHWSAMALVQVRERQIKFLKPTDKSWGLVSLFGLIGVWLRKNNWSVISFKLTTFCICDKAT